MASEEEAESTAAMPPGAVVKEEEVIPPMPPDAFIKDEVVVPPMPPGASWSLREEEEEDVH